jgi:hypothetical protein
MNCIVCPQCLISEPKPYEEKSCSHGTAIGSQCVRCGRLRTADDEYFACLGTMTRVTDASESGSGHLQGPAKDE